MLIRYKKTYEKIAMDLLSYMPEEQSAKMLQEKIQMYENDPTLELYLWKDGEDFIGLVGIEMEEETYTLIDIAVNPSFRGEGTGKEMVNGIAQRYPEKHCLSTKLTQAFLDKCAVEPDSEN